MKTKVITKAHIAEQIKELTTLTKNELKNKKPRTEFIRLNTKSIAWYKSLQPTI